MEKKYGSILLGLAKRDSAVQRASGARYSLFVSFRRGMETLVSTIVGLLPKESIKLKTPVKHVQRSEQGWELVLANGERSQTDAICLCTGAPQSAKLLELQDRALSAELASIPYTHSITLNMAFDASLIRHPMDGVGFVTPQREAQPAIACTFVHRKFAGRAPEGTALLRAFLGGAHQADLLGKDDQALSEIVLNQVGRLLGISGPPMFTSVERWPAAMPQYTLGHIPRVLKIEETLLGLPGLALAGNWQYGAGVPDCIESGERAADRLLQRLDSCPTQNSWVLQS
jgi:oxygen-dependent protoporphyrinogen oxidase